MKRSDELVPLSRDHHVALERALRLSRSTPDGAAGAVAAFLAYQRERGERHFRQEEELLLPAVPTGARALADRVLREHRELRDRSEELAGEQRPPLDRVHELGRLLHDHVRFEERELFPLLERELSPEALRTLAGRLREGRDSGGR